MKTVMTPTSDIFFDNYGVDKWTATLYPHAQERLGVRGCPMGRGSSKHEARGDLVDRIYKESHIVVHFVVH